MSMIKKQSDMSLLKFSFVQMIDYKTQQNRLFPLLASAFAFRFASDWLKSLYTDVKQRLQVNDFSTLPEAHACTAGLKALTTAATAEGIEECRKLCGGHGYLISSVLPEQLNYLHFMFPPVHTKTKMLSCCFRWYLDINHMVKTVSDLGNKLPVGTAAYLGRVASLTQKNCVVQTAEGWLNPGATVEAFEARAARMAAGYCQRLTEYKSPEEGFAELSADLVEASLAHCQVIVALL